MQAGQDTPWPTEIRLRDKGRTLTVTFEGGESHDLPAELLRVESPSAEVRGHAPSQRKSVPGKRQVAIIKVVPVGNYAVRLEFDDMHATGIYTWAFLLDLGRNREGRFAAYLAELKKKGLSREAPAPR